MAKADSFLEDLLGRLAGISGLRSRAMFGGWGLYADRAFFAIVYRQRVYFRTSPATCSRYSALGMGPFRPNEKQTLWDYYEVPGAVLDDSDELLAWAREAIETRTT